MSRSVFLAYPLSGAADLDELEAFVNSVRRRLDGAGWQVLPERGGPERLRQDQVASPAEVLASNVSAVTGADVLVLLLPAVTEPTSIWVELGMALAARRPVVVVAPPEATIPHLALLALAAGGADGLHRAKRVEARVPGETEFVDHLVGRIIIAADSLVR